MSADSRDNTNLWAVGRTVYTGNRNVFYYSKGTFGNFYNFPGSDQYFNVCALSTTVAIFGGQSQQGNLGKIVKYTDGAFGNVIDVTSITGFINGIHFFDDKKGIVLGDPNSTTNKWGIGMSNDGGATWTAINNQPASQSGEEGWNSVFFGNETNAWFGTNKGRILRTSDKGLTWGTSNIKDAVNIIGIAFLDNNNGFAIYSKSTSQGAPYYLAVTSTGGATWNGDKYDFASKNLKPVKVFALPDAKRVYILCQTGQIFATQYGNTFEPVLTIQQGAVQSGDIISSELEKARMWILGLKMGYLDFNYKSDQAVRKLEAVNGLSYEFPQTQIGEYNNIKIKLKNTGNVDINVDYFITNDDGSSAELFKISGVVIKAFAPEVEKEVTVRFTPQEEGTKNATLKISNTDDKVPMLSIALKAEGVAKTGVADENTSYISIFPNPADGGVQISFDSPSACTAGIWLIDPMGRQALLGNYAVDFGMNRIHAGIEEFSPGAYTLKIVLGSNVYTGRIIIR